ncbi:MAG: hypothetical protein Q9209_000892 [Squamulea sp. 1 TL-2023]
MSAYKPKRTRCFTHFIYHCPETFTAFSAALAHLQSNRCRSGITSQDLDTLVRNFRYSDALINPQRLNPFAANVSWKTKSWRCIGCEKKFESISWLFKHVEGYGCATSMHHKLFAELETYISEEVRNWKGIKTGMWTSKVEEHDNELVSQPVVQNRNIDSSSAIFDIPKADNFLSGHSSFDGAIDSIGVRHPRIQQHTFLSQIIPSGIIDDMDSISFLFESMSTDNGVGL